MSSNKALFLRPKLPTKKLEWGSREAPIFMVTRFFCLSTIKRSFRLLYALFCFFLYIRLCIAHSFCGLGKVTPVSGSVFSLCRFVFVTRIYFFFIIGHGKSYTRNYILLSYKTQISQLLNWTILGQTRGRRVAMLQLP